MERQRGCVPVNFAPTLALSLTLTRSLTLTPSRTPTLPPAPAHGGTMGDAEREASVSVPARSVRSLCS
jgi:hypothetical protein